MKRTPCTPTHLHFECLAQVRVLQPLPLHAQGGEAGEGTPIALKVRDEVVDHRCGDDVACAAHRH